MPSLVTLAMNDQLLRQFTEEEVNATLSQMHPHKSLRPDGYSVIFYQKTWATVGPHVRQAVLMEAQLMWLSMQLILS
jgi:hypothetical protein